MILRILYDSYRYYMILYDTIWFLGYYMIPMILYDSYDTLWYYMILYNTIWYYMIPRILYNSI